MTQKTRRLRFRMIGDNIDRDCIVEDAETGERIEGVCAVRFEVRGRSECPMVVLEMEALHGHGAIVNIDTSVDSFADKTIETCREVFERDVPFGAEPVFPKTGGPPRHHPERES